ncbi:MAG: potassium-transporting ATPase subunit KdpC [Bacteroidetes bacterium]|nr:potassium-transporting ATPase subunit KdpC [Bacteroidota bacterium]
MKKHIWDSMKMLLAMTVLTGIIYPLAMTGIAQIVFPKQANGSMIRINGKLVGSSLIGQNFASDKYFWPRPSAVNYNPLPSGASNYGPTSDTLKELVEMRRNNFIRLNGLPSNTQVPPDMLYASGSGLDPDISPKAAELQIDRVAHARHFDAKEKRELVRLVKSHLEGPQLGFLGEPRVNVLMLNLALDTLGVTRK